MEKDYRHLVLELAEARTEEKERKDAAASEERAAELARRRELLSPLLAVLRDVEKPCGRELFVSCLDYGTSHVHDRPPSVKASSPYAAFTGKVAIDLNPDVPGQAQLYNLTKGFVVAQGKAEDLVPQLVSLVADMVRKRQGTVRDTARAGSIDRRTGGTHVDESFRG
jgi:hypothetical protein